MKKVSLFLVSLLLLASCSNDDDINNLKGIKVSFATDEESFYFGEKKEFEIEMEGVKELYIYKPDGWKTSIDENILSIEAPSTNNKLAEREGSVTIIATGENDASAVANLEVSTEYQVTIIDFEGVDKELLAGPSSYGENLYPHYSGESPAKYEGYLNTEANLFFNTTTGGYGFASGGIALSQWTNAVSAGHLNQCSVFSDNPVENKGGNEESSTFAVSFSPSFGASGAFMHFKDDEEKLIDHLFITNNTYAVLSMKHGDGFARAHSYENKDWFKLTFIGYDSKGIETGKVDFFLSDFRAEDAQGIVTEWTKVDLTDLGDVNKITFEMTGSDGSGMWLNTPAYFCMDDIMILH